MRTVLKIHFLFLLILFSCNTTQNNSISPKSKSIPTEYNLTELEKNTLPKLKQEVNDFEELFSKKEVKNLTLIIRDFERKTTNQIAIVSVKTIGEYSEFNKFSNDLSNYNRVGLKEINNGLTIVFSKNLREIWISTGMGIQKSLTNEICEEVINQFIIPEFKNGDYLMELKLA